MYGIFPVSIYERTSRRGSAFVNMQVVYIFNVSAFNVFDQ
jgi:hypothetical protein